MTKLLLGLPTRSKSYDEEPIDDQANPGKTSDADVNEDAEIMFGGPY
jgi:hypothetical protein